ncbi:MAG: hypothetical protein Q8P67_13550, partial [archaeon]|nr:hypothetical protein [archaeon]
GSAQIPPTVAASKDAAAAGPAATTSRSKHTFSTKVTHLRINLELVPRHCLKDLGKLIHTKLMTRMASASCVESYKVSAVAMLLRPPECYQKFLDKTRLSEHGESYGIGAPWAISGISIGHTLALDPPHFIRRTCQSSVFKMLSASSEAIDPDTEISVSFAKVPFGNGSLLTVQHANLFREAIFVGRDMWNPIWDQIGAFVVESAPILQSASLKAYSVSESLDIFSNQSLLSSVTKSPARVLLEEDSHRVWLFNEVLEISIRKNPQAVDSQSSSSRILLWRTATWPKHQYAITYMKVHRIIPRETSRADQCPRTGVFLALSHHQILSKSKKNSLHLWDTLLLGLSSAQANFSLLPPFPDR